ncbi:MAG: PqqD family protein [Gemmatimonadaceae bacterium]|nr:PqqD family protein [Gemmatimonadaceae bacterium]
MRLTRLDDDGVALHLAERKYVTVNGSGATILEALETPRTLDELVAVVCAEYDTTVDEARTTVEAFLAECEQAKLVERSS